MNVNYPLCSNLINQVPIVMPQVDNTLLLAIIGHLVGDYLLQNDWMALNKKSNAWICGVHCFIWASCVTLFAGWWHNNFAWGVLYLTHLIQDHTQVVRFWMTRINRQPKFVEPTMAPWSLIVVDNVWHIVTIWAVWKFLV